MVKSIAELARAKPKPRLLRYVEGAWVDTPCDCRMVSLFRVEKGPMHHFLAGTGVRLCVSFMEGFQVHAQHVPAFFVTADMRILWSFCRVPGVYLRKTDERVRCPLGEMVLRDGYEFRWRVRWQQEAPVVRGILFRRSRLGMASFADICAEVDLVGVGECRASLVGVEGAFRANALGVGGTCFELDLLRVLTRVCEVSGHTYTMATCFLLVEVAVGLGGDVCKDGSLARLIDKALVVLPPWFQPPEPSMADVLEGLVLYRDGVSLLVARYTLEDVIDYAEGLAGCVLGEV